MVIYHAPFLQLTSRNHYPKAKEIVNSFFPREKEDIKRNLHVIISNLLVHPSITVSRKHSFYKFYGGPSWYTKYKAVTAQDLLIEKKLVRLKRGHNSLNGKGFSSTLTSTKNLEKLLGGTVLENIKADQNDYPTLTLDRNPLTLEEIYQFEDFLLNSDSLINKDVLIKAYKDTERLNKEYFSKMTLGFEPGTMIVTGGMTFEEARKIPKHKRTSALDMVSNVFFTSMFSLKGDGRLFQRCNSYQNLKKNIRKYLTLNGASTTETDYSSMHTNLAYFLSDSQNPYPDDSYSPVISELGLKNTPPLRDAIKKSVIIAFNTSSFNSYSKAMRWTHKEQTKLLNQKGISARKVYEAFIKLNPKLTPLLTSKFIPANKLMFYESQIMKKGLNKIWEQNIDGIPLHDSMLHDVKHKLKVKKIMKDAYKSFTGYEIGVKTL